MTDEEIEKLEDLNLFRFDNYFYRPVFFVGLIFLLLSFFIPYTGWRMKPETPPKDMDEYVSRVTPYLVLALVFVIPPIINWTVKKIELTEGTKKVVSSEVVYRANLLFRRKLLIFRPFKVVIYKRGFNFSQIKTGDKVILNLTYFGRILNFDTVN